MIAILESAVKRVPCIRPVISSVGLALDVKEIVENSTPIGAAKIIAGRISKECIPPELLIAGKYVILCGGLVVSVSTCSNPLIVNGTLSAARSIIKN